MLAKDGCLHQFSNLHNFHYADGYSCKCIPILCWWMSDLVEKNKLMNLKSNACTNCKALVETYGDYPLQGQRPAQHNHNQYVKAFDNI